MEDTSENPTSGAGGGYCCARRACVPSSEHTFENVYKDGHGGNAIIAAAFRSPGQANPWGSPASWPTLFDESVEDSVSKRKVETSQKRQTRLSPSLHMHRYTHALTHLSMHANIHSCTRSHIRTYPHTIIHAYICTDIYTLIYSYLCMHLHSCTHTPKNITASILLQPNFIFQLKITKPPEHMSSLGMCVHL